MTAAETSRFEFLPRLLLRSEVVLSSKYVELPALRPAQHNQRPLRAAVARPTREEYADERIEWKEIGGEANRGV